MSESRYKGRPSVDTSSGGQLHWIIVTQCVRGFVGHQKCATVQIHLSRDAADFSKTEEHNYFPDPANVAARVIVLGALCLLRP
jgi:hypothetical protein